ncbi:MAG: hypothetical protein IPP97_05660 [Candidatus Obscuribacter sp.]|nr:hypothetical protein [Candidatus Obscuribacter sp.]MBP6350918.1 hypothetical protein [Candidatus Obscuribacter sp.]MBP7575697.1 hypothetical protein [Candidatus Obscuribacter sp.]
MTDGPFKNAGLTARWKKVGNALENDAVSSDERTERTERALSKDLPKEFRALVQDLASGLKNLPEGSPRLAVEDIFDKHPTSPLANTLHLFLSSNLSRPMDTIMAFECALDNTIKKEMYSARNRMYEESLLARDRRDLASDRFATVVTRLDETMNSISVSRLRDDVLTNKTAPRAAFAKRTGLDDGPSI